MKYDLKMLVAMPVLALAVSGCAATPNSQANAQSSKLVRLCDSQGCRMVDPSAPPAKNLSKPENNASIKMNAYRGESLADLEALLDQGNAVAGYKLGTVYEKGLAGVPVNINKAARFYERSADLGEPSSARAIALIYLGAASTEESTAAPNETLAGGPDYSASQNAYTATADQRRKAVAYLYKAAEGGDALGMLELGRQLYSGGFVEKDLVAAGNLFDLAAEQGISEAKYYLGQMYFRGTGRQQNGYQAIKWTRDAAKSGNVLAQRALGQLYINGYETVNPDGREAQRWLSAAAQNGDPESAKLLELLQSGRYVPGGSTFTSLMSAGDIVKASEAAMRGIEAARKRLEQGGSLADPITIDWGQPSVPAGAPATTSPNTGQTSVRPAPAGANCYIIEHTARVEGKTQERTEKVCQGSNGGYSVAI